MGENLTVFALNSSRDFGLAVANHLGVKLDPHEERDFEDGEHKIRQLVSASGTEDAPLYTPHMLVSVGASRGAAVSDLEQRLGILVQAAGNETADF